MLLHEYAATFKKQVKTSVSDGQGGQTVTYTDGAQITLYPKIDSNSDSRIPDQQQLRTRYTFLCAKSVQLDFYDVIKDSAGNLYRITGKSGDMKTPASSSLDLTSVTAERVAIN